MDWQNWCRLCGDCHTISSFDPEIKETVKVLNLQINPENLKICYDCNSYLETLGEFLVKAKLMQHMFLELENFEMIKSAQNQPSTAVAADSMIQPDNSIEFMNNIRNRFGLEDIVESKTELIESLFNEASMSNALQIKVEPDMKHLEQHSDDEDEEQIDELEDLDESDDASSNAGNTNESKLSLKVEDESMSDEEEKGGKSGGSGRPKRRRNSSKEKSPKKHKTQETVYEITCNVCKEQFRDISALNRHCQNGHQAPPDLMCHCGKVLKNLKQLMVHRRRHFPEKYKFECKDCRLFYTIKKSYDTHMEKKHGPNAKKFICQHCAKCFRDKRLLQSHEKTHLPDELKHIYPCEICLKKFVTKSTLRNHITSVHEMAPLYTCEQCGKSFSTKSNLKSHLYSHSDVKNVQCDICSARFKNMDSLRKHKRTHMEKSHACPICGTCYRNKNNLRAHMVVHSEEKPYKCTYCPNEYKRSKDLKDHMNLHSGERPHQCPFCSRTFVNGSNCRKHKLKDHPEELAHFEALHGKGKAAVTVLHTMKQTYDDFNG